MDLLSLVFVAILASQSQSSQPLPTGQCTRAVIIDTGVVVCLDPSSSTSESDPLLESARSQIIDTGDH
jgi:hypothetical protein